MKYSGRNELFVTVKVTALEVALGQKAKEPVAKGADVYPKASVQ